MRCWIWLALSLTLTLPCHAAETPSPERQTELQNLLVQDCGSCHGLKMRGGLGPALLPDALSSRSPDYLTATILHGRPGSAMPPWRDLLTPAEARWIADRLLDGVKP
jgi:cytochrome c55X